jgi:hypothetical protein
VVNGSALTATAVGGTAVLFDGSVAALERACAPEVASTPPLRTIRALWAPVAPLTVTVCSTAVEVLRRGRVSSAVSTSRPGATCAPLVRPERVTPPSESRADALYWDWQGVLKGWLAGVHVPLGEKARDRFTTRLVCPRVAFEVHVTIVVSEYCVGVTRGTCDT